MVLFNFKILASFGVNSAQSQLDAFATGVAKFSSNLQCPFDPKILMDPFKLRLSEKLWMLLRSLYPQALPFDHLDPFAEHMIFRLSALLLSFLFQPLFISVIGFDAAKLTSNLLVLLPTHLFFLLYFFTHFSQGLQFPRTFEHSRVQAHQRFN